MLDIILLVILLIAAVWGFMKGMVKVLFSLGGYVVAFLVARIYSPRLAQWMIEFSTWDDRLSESINSNLQSYVVDNLNQAASQFTMNDIATLPEFAKIKELTQGFAAEAFSTNIAAADLGLDFSMAGDAFAYYILLAISAIVLFLGVKLVLGIAGTLLHNVLSLSGLLSATDRLIGLVLGVLVGALVVFFVVSVLTPISLTMVELGMVDALENSKIASFIIDSGLYQSIMLVVTSRVSNVSGA